MLSRRRRQKGSVRLRGRKTKFWEGIYWVDILDTDGQIAGRRQRFVNLGYPSELPTKKAALRRMDDILREVTSPNYEPESQVTLGDFINKIYIPIELRTKRPSTARDVKNALKKHIIPKFGCQQMTHIPKFLVKQYFLDLLDESGLAWNTVNKVKNYMSGVYSSAIDAECGVKFNPVRGIKLPRPTPAEAGQTSELLADNDVVAIEEGLPDELARTVWWLGASTGARKGELRALRVGSIDEKACQLIITRSRFEGKEGPPKSRKSIRRIDLTHRQLVRLKNYLRLYPNALPEDYFFPSRRKRKGQQVPVCLERLMEKIIKPVVRKLGIKKVGWHMLRHWNSTTMDESGFSSKVRQERLGHASATTTNEHYTHVRDTVSRKAAEAIDRRLEKSRRRSQLGKKKQLLREIVGTNVGTEVA